MGRRTICLAKCIQSVLVGPRADTSWPQFLFDGHVIITMYCVLVLSILHISCQGPEPRRSPATTQGLTTFRTKVAVHE